MADTMQQEMEAQNQEGEQQTPQRKSTQTSQGSPASKTPVTTVTAPSLIELARQGNLARLRGSVPGKETDVNEAMNRLVKAAEFRVLASALGGPERGAEGGAFDSWAKAQIEADTQLRNTLLQSVLGGGENPDSSIIRELALRALDKDGEQKGGAKDIILEKLLDHALTKPTNEEKSGALDTVLAVVKIMDAIKAQQPVAAPPQDPFAMINGILGLMDRLRPPQMAAQQPQQTILNVPNVGQMTEGLYQWYVETDLTVKRELRREARDEKKFADFRSFATDLAQNLGRVVELMTVEDGSGRAAPRGIAPAEEAEESPKVVSVAACDHCGKEVSVRPGMQRFRCPYCREVSIVESDDVPLAAPLPAMNGNGSKRHSGIAAE